MIRAVLWALVLLVPTPAWALDDDNDKEKGDKPPSPAEELNKLQKEFQTKQSEILKDYRAAKTAADRQKALTLYYKLPPEYSGKFMKLAEKYPTEPVAVDALIMVVNYSRFGQGGPGNSLEKALELLAKNHIKSEKLGPLCQQLSYNPTDVSLKFVKAVLAKNPNKNAKAWACYSLGKIYKQKSETAFRAKNKKLADQLSKDAEKHLELVTTKYGDVKAFGNKKLADTAKGELFEIRFLSVGKVAPDIEGEDIDGKKFKLSDYRGKVVMLDFWGHW